QRVGSNVAGPHSPTRIVEFDLGPLWRTPANDDLRACTQRGQRPAYGIRRDEDGAILDDFSRFSTGQTDNSLRGRQPWKADDEHHRDHEACGATHGNLLRLPWRIASEETRIIRREA